MTSLISTHNLAWTWWINTWSLWRSEQRLNRIMPSNYGKRSDYTGLRYILLGCLIVYMSMHACECLSRVGADCEIFGPHDWTGQNWTCWHLWAVALASAQRISISAPAPLLIHGYASTLSWSLPDCSKFFTLASFSPPFLPLWEKRGSGSRRAYDWGDVGG